MITEPNSPPKKFSVVDALLLGGGLFAMLMACLLLVAMALRQPLAVAEVADVTEVAAVGDTAVSPAAIPDHPIITVNQATFEQNVVTLSADVPVAVFFTAEWCGYCRDLEPILEEVATDGQYHFILAKLDIDNNPGLARQFGVRSVPDVKVFQQGTVTNSFHGGQPEPFVRDFMATAVPTP